MDWTKVEQELLHFKSLEGLSDLAIDTLYGSMWSLDPHPSQTFEVSLPKFMEKNREKVLQYSIQRVQKLSQEPNIGFLPRKTPRCASIGIGTFGWKYDPKIIQQAIKKGVYLIDTAEGYGYGRVEQWLGKALEGIKFEGVSTKVRKDHMSSTSIVQAVYRSLKKLGRTFHMQLHYPNYKHPNAIKQLALLRQKGIIQSIGVGNCSVDMVEEWQRTLSDFSGDVIYSVQVPFSLLEPRVKKELLPYCQQRGILLLAYSPLGQSFKKLNKPILEDMAKRHDATPAQVALSWLSSQKGVLPIPRTNSLKHLDENIESIQLKLSKQQIQELEEGYNEI